MAKTILEIIAVGCPQCGEIETFEIRTKYVKGEKTFDADLIKCPNCRHLFNLKEQLTKEEQ